MKSISVTFLSSNGTSDFQYTREFKSAEKSEAGYSQGEGSGFFRFWAGGEFLIVPHNRVISIEGVE